MANRIYNDYRSHIENTSPDMDKLWNRIEQKIDGQQNNAPKVEDTPHKPQITVKKTSVFKYAAIAACFVAVIAGTVIFLNSKDSSVKTSETSYKNATLSAAANDNNKQEAADAVSQAPATNREAIAKADNDSAQDADRSKKLIAEKKTETVEPKEQIKLVMTTTEYLGADIDKKIKMIEDLAAKLKRDGTIKDYTVKKRDVNSRIEIVLNDGTRQGIILK